MINETVVAMFDVVSSSRHGIRHTCMPIQFNIVSHSKFIKSAVHLSICQTVLVDTVIYEDGIVDDQLHHYLSDYNMTSYRSHVAFLTLTFF